MMMGASPSPSKSRGPASLVAACEARPCGRHSPYCPCCVLEPALTKRDLPCLACHPPQSKTSHQPSPPGPVNGTRCPVPVPCRAWSLEPKSQRRPEPWRVRSDTIRATYSACWFCSAAAQRRSRTRQGCGVLDSWLAPIRLTSTRAERHLGAGRCDL